MISTKPWSVDGNRVVVLSRRVPIDRADLVTWTGPALRCGLRSGGRSAANRVHADGARARLITDKSTQSETVSAFSVVRAGNLAGEARGVADHVSDAWTAVSLAAVTCGVLRIVGGVSADIADDAYRGITLRQGRMKAFKVDECSRAWFGVLGEGDAVVLATAARLSLIAEIVVVPTGSPFRDAASGSVGDDLLEKTNLDEITRRVALGSDGLCDSALGSERRTGREVAGRGQGLGELAVDAPGGVGGQFAKQARAREHIGDLLDDPI